MDEAALIVSIVTSLIASFLFWIVFNLIPWICKYIRIRPRVEKDIMDIKTHLLFFIDIPFLQSVHSPSVFQPDIEKQKICKADFENALYGKCLSVERCIGEFEHRLLPVGKKLESNANELDKRLDKIQRYSDHLKTREILLLKEIGEKIHKYDFVEHNEVIDGMVFRSVDPTISYMKENFYELYSLYHVLKRKCDSFCLIKRNDFEKYRIAKQKLEGKHYISYFVKWIFLDKKYKILVELRHAFLKNNEKKVQAKLKKYLELDKEKLVYLRGHLDYLASEQEYRDICISVRGESEVEEWLCCVNSESMRKKNFRSRNAENKKRIDEMIKNTPKITELDEAKLRSINKLFDGYL